MNYEKNYLIKYIPNFNSKKKEKKRKSYSIKIV
jgi:hypothetical protein